MKTQFIHTIKFLDIIIFVFILIISILFTIIYFKRGLIDPDNVEITFNNNLLVYPLSNNATYTVNGTLGNTIIEVKNRNVRILSSPCREKSCTIGSINKTGESLVCLPNGVIVTLRSLKGGSNEDALLSY